MLTSRAQHEGGLFIAPRTVLKVMAWGDHVEYPNGKLSYSFVCPVLDIGLPRGYLTTKSGICRAAKRHTRKLSPETIRAKKFMNLPYWDSATPMSTLTVTKTKPKKSPQRVRNAKTESSLANLNSPVRSSAKGAGRVAQKSKARSSLLSMREETRKLEAELAIMEKRAASEIDSA